MDNELLKALIEFHEIIGRRHHGRMPEEVELSYNRCSELINKWSFELSKGPILPTTNKCCRFLK